MGKRTSETPATRFLKGAGVAFTERHYDYLAHGGTAEAARQLGHDEHAIIKTLVMKDGGSKTPDCAHAWGSFGFHQKLGTCHRHQNGHAL